MKTYSVASAETFWHLL